ncbi:unnamed protein product [Amoebophrya sp. A120]|nr:unnamed protein product [Amoebophrya sp. A120]|eukprot:GSA120T00023995001.1
MAEAFQSDIRIDAKQKRNGALLKNFATATTWTSGAFIPCYKYNPEGIFTNLNVLFPVKTPVEIKQTTSSQRPKSYQLRHENHVERNVIIAPLARDNSGKLRRLPRAFRPVWPVAR